MINLAPTPTPTPAPTVTVTITPTPAPTVYVQVPNQGIDPVKDVLLGDFGGAVLGAVVAVLLAIYGVSRALSSEADRRQHERELEQKRHDAAQDAERDQRERERAAERDRRDFEQAARVYAAALRVDHGATTRNPSLAHHAMYALVESALLLSRPRAADPHSDFRSWLLEAAEKVGRDIESPWESMPDRDIHQMRETLMPIVYGVRDWMIDPLEWSPPGRPGRDDEGPHDGGPDRLS